MLSNYNIVWFDDEFNSLEAIRMHFEDHQIYSEGFENAEEGIKFIQTDFQSIDALVIDGNFFKNKNDNAIDESGKALNMVIDALKEIKFKKDIPYFILSGKVNFRERKNPLIDIFNIERIYDKLEDNDLDDLCKAIIEKADNSLIGSLRIKYRDVFSICDEDKFGKECFEKISSLAQSLESPSLPGTSEDLFLPIRKLLEKLFERLAGIEVIDPDFTTQNGSVNGCSRFLSNKLSDYKVSTDIQPLILDAISRLLNIVQDSTHAKKGLNLKVDEYSNKFRANYLYKSSVYLLFEILVYFDKYIADHQCFESNSAMWEKKIIIDNAKQLYTKNELIQGTILNIGINGYGAFLPDGSNDTLGIPPHRIKEFELFKGQKIKVKTEQKGDKTHIIHIEI